MLRKSPSKEEREATFQLFFLEDGSSQSVEVVEANKVDFEKVKKRLVKEAIELSGKSIPLKQQAFSIKGEKLLNQKR